MYTLPFVLQHFPHSVHEKGNDSGIQEGAAGRRASITSADVLYRENESLLDEGIKQKDDTCVSSRIKYKNRLQAGCRAT